MSSHFQPAFEVIVAVPFMRASNTQSSPDSLVASPVPALAAVLVQLAEVLGDHEGVVVEGDHEVVLEQAPDPRFLLGRDPDVVGGHAANLPDQLEGPVVGAGLEVTVGPVALVVLPFHRVVLLSARPARLGPAAIRTAFGLWRDAAAYWSVSG